MDDEVTIDASEHHEFYLFVLLVFGTGEKHVVALIRDIENSSCAYFRHFVWLLQGVVVTALASYSRIFVHRGSSSSKKFTGLWNEFRTLYQRLY